MPVLLEAVALRTCLPGRDTARVSATLPPRTRRLRGSLAVVHRLVRGLPRGAAGGSRHGKNAARLQPVRRTRIGQRRPRRRSPLPLIRLRNGLVFWQKDFSDRAEALEAAGLREWQHAHFQATTRSRGSVRPLVDRGWYSWKPGLFGGFRFSRQAGAHDLKRSEGSAAARLRLPGWSRHRPGSSPR
jgi:hypothetical protein